MSPERFIEFLSDQRASAILRCDDQEIAAGAMAAAVGGGFRVVEFTLTIPGAFDLIEEFSSRPGLVVGAGTVLDSIAAEKAVESGARFLVSPVVDVEVIAAARGFGVAVMPGAHSPTEMLRAHRAGAQLQKLFPAPGLGPAYVRACLGPLPFLRIVPTHGVDLDNALEWLDAGAWALGLVAPLFPEKLLRERRFDEIEERAREFRARLAGEDP